MLRSVSSKLTSHHRDMDSHPSYPPWLTIRARRACNERRGRCRCVRSNATCSIYVYTYIRTYMYPLTMSYQREISYYAHPTYLHTSNLLPSMVTHLGSCSVYKVLLIYCSDVVKQARRVCDERGRCRCVRSVF